MCNFSCRLPLKVLKVAIFVACYIYASCDTCIVPSVFPHERFDSDNDGLVGVCVYGLRGIYS